MSSSRRPQRSIQPTAKLGTDNHGEIELTAHRRIVAAAQKSCNTTSSPTLSPSFTSPEPSQSGVTTDITESTVPDSSDDVATSADPGDDVETPIVSKIIKRRQPEVLSSDEEAVEDSGPQSPKSPCRRQKKKKKKQPTNGMFFVDPGNTS